MICLIENGDFHSYVSLRFFTTNLTEPLPHALLIQADIELLVHSSGLGRHRNGLVEGKINTKPLPPKSTAFMVRIVICQFCNPTQIQLGVQLKY